MSFSRLRRFCRLVGHGRRADTDVGDSPTQSPEPTDRVEASVLAILSCAHCEVETPEDAVETARRCRKASLYAQIPHMAERAPLGLAVLSLRSLGSRINAAQNTALVGSWRGRRISGSAPHR